MTERVSTGIPALDRKFDGGVPAGSLVTLLADPASQAELLLGRLTTQRRTTYLSSERAPTAVASALREQRGSYDDVTVSRLDRDAPVVDAVEHVDGLPDESLLIVDPVESLERVDAGQYRAFLDRLQSALSRTDGVAVLHALKHADPPAQRHRTEYVSDVVLDLETDATEDAIETRLHVPKFRGGPALTDPVTLELTDRVAVDNSRDIA